MKRIKVRPIRPNRLFETWIEEWRDEAVARNSELQYHFSNALKALKKYPLPLHSGQECLLLQHFGQKLCAMIDKKLEKHVAANSSEFGDAGDVQQCSVSSEISEKSQQSEKKNRNVEPVVYNCTSHSEVEKIASSGASNKSSFTLPPDTYDIILLVDRSEVKRSEQCELVTTVLSREKVLFEIRHLHVGDFTWIARCRNTKRELVLPYIIERKRKNDLGSSIRDGRFHEQKFRLKQSGIHNIIYMVESLFDGSANFRMPLTTLLQASNNSLVQDGFFLKFTRSHRDSMLYLSTFTRILDGLFAGKHLVECSKNNLPSTFNPKNREISLMAFDNFNKASAKVKTLTVKNMFVRQLLQMHGLSLDAVLAIVKRYPTPTVLRAAFQSTPDGDKLLASLQVGRTKRKLGPVLAKKLFRLYAQEVIE